MDLEARFVEHIEHRRVVEHRHRLEPQEPVTDGNYCEPFEQDCAEAFALKPIVDRKRNFRCRRVGLEIRADGDRAALPLDLAKREERRRLSEIG